MALKRILCAAKCPWSAALFACGDNTVHGAGREMDTERERQREGSGEVPWLADSQVRHFTTRVV